MVGSILLNEVHQAMRKLLLIFALFVSLTCVAQETKRLYVKKSKQFIQLIAGDTLVYHGFIKSKEGRQLFITTPESKYIITVKRGPQGNYQEIRKVDGELVGTVYLSGKFKNDVVVPSGEHYDWKKTDRHTWYYQFEGKTILTGKYRKVEKERRFLQTTEAGPVNEILILSSYERGLKAMESHPAPIIAIALFASSYLLYQSTLDNNPLD